MMKFDVLVSFRGIDTRRTFVSHLLLSLYKKRITTFKHEEEIPRNQPPSSQVLQAIEKSKIAIAVISKNYAASSWCLDELAKIIDCKEKGLLVFVPIFYEVDPSYVIRQVDDLEDHVDGDNNFEKVNRWKDALAISIQIYHQDYSYWEDEDSYSYIIDRVMIYVSQCLSATAPSESEILSDEESFLWEEDGLYELEPYCLREELRLVEPHVCLVIPTTSLLSLLSPIVTKGIELVRAALKKIAEIFIYEEESSGVKPRPEGRLVDMEKDNYVMDNNLSRLLLSNDFNRFVGMDRLTKAVYTLLDLESRDGILEIGISGERGVGKTTLARFVYEQISPQFQDHHYFVKNTTNCSIGTCLLDDIARASLEEDSESLDEVVKVKLGHRKVLLVVDDMFEFHHLENIRKIARWFGPGSRLIFVTDHKLLPLYCGVERVFVVEPLRYDEALQLFSQFAFKQEQVPREYHRLSVRAVLITGRIPLALKVFGSFLCGKLISEWELELCRLEGRQNNNYLAKVSSYIGDALS